MKIIHTSDWHLGQNFMGKSRAPEHQAFFTWLLEQIEEHQVDAVIVAGDIFDTGAPPSYAREMYNRFIVDIQGKGCQLVILGGNHDSVATLNESKELLACLNTHLVSGVTTNLEDQVITLNNRQGEVGAILCAIPFIRQRDVLLSQAGQSGQDKQQAMQQAIATHYQRLYKQAVNLRDDYKQALPIIATGHLTTVGASTTESVRDIYIGTLEAFPAKSFPPADYIALGHIHKSQLVAKSEHIRYSGSPIPLSFDETGRANTKSVLLVDFKDGKFVKAKALEIPCFQAMAVIKGDLEHIEKQIEERTTEVVSSTHFNKDQTLWLEVIVSSQDYLNDLQLRLQQMTEALPVEILLLRRERKNRKLTFENEEKETLNELSVHEVFERRLDAEIWESNGDKERAERLKLMFNQVVVELSEDENERTGKGAKA